MELYCISNNCHLKNVKILAINANKCRACSNPLVSLDQKLLYEDIPLKLVEQFQNWNSMKLKSSTRFLEESIILYHLHLCYIGSYFIARYMQSYKRNNESNKLIFKALKENTLMSWHNWVKYIFDTNVKNPQKDQVDFLINLFDHEKNPQYWLDHQDGKFIKKQCSFAHMVLFMNEHKKNNKRLINDHVLIIISAFNRFFLSIHTFKKERFYNLTNDQLFKDFIKKQSGITDFIKSAYRLTNQSLSLVRINKDESKFTVTQPVHLLSLFDLYIEWELSSSSQQLKNQNQELFSNPIFKKQEVDNVFKEKMTRVSDSSFQKMKSASFQKKDNVLSVFSVPKKFKHLTFLETSDNEKTYFMCKLLDIYSTQKTHRIELNALKKLLDSFQDRINWQDGFFSALWSGDILWYNNPNNDGEVYVEFHPYYNLKYMIKKT